MKAESLVLSLIVKTILLVPHAIEEIFHRVRDNYYLSNMFFLFPRNYLPHWGLFANDKSIRRSVNFLH
jgi:hypothetical protein